MARCCICFRRLPNGAICPADGTRAANRHVDAIIGDPPPSYSATSVLGVGGFATTWEVTDSSGKTFALKWGRRATRAAICRFQRETEILSETGSEIAPILIASGVLQGRPYILQERLLGDPLGILLERLDSSLSIPEVVRIATAIARTMGALHAKGIVHCDLKPENIFVSGTQCRFIDFGVSTRTSELLQGAGSAQYAAPEHWREAKPDAAIDVYSWGVLAYELICMRLPFVGEGKAIQYEHATLRPPKPSEFADVPTSLENLVLSALAKNPDDRPTVPEILATLGNLGSEAARFRSCEGAPIVTSVPALVLNMKIKVDAVAAYKLARRFHATIVEHGQNQLRLAWSTDSHHDAQNQAQECAMQAINLGAQCVYIHLLRAQVVVHRGTRLLFGRSLEDSSQWPLGQWEGVKYSSSATLAQPETRVQTRFIGRQKELNELFVEADLAFSSGIPRACCLFGEPGVGTTRLMQELRARLDVDDTLQCVSLRDIEIESDEGEAILDMCISGPVLVLADKLHDMNSETLSIVEYLLLPESDKPIFLLATASDAFVQNRPDWGKRCASSQTLPIASLSQEETCELLQQLLRPVEYIPRSVLRELSQWCRGVPKAACDIAERLRKDGFITQTKGGAYKLQTEQLKTLSTRPLDEWIASQSLKTMGREVGSFALVCSQLAPGFCATIAREVSDMVSFSSELADFSVALFLLEKQGILALDSELYSFVNPLVRTALADRLGQRQRVEIHRAALRVWQNRNRDRDALRAIAFHGEVAGQGLLAVQANLELADEERRCHRAVDAHRYYSQSLELLGESSDKRSLDQHILRYRSLMGLGWTGYRIDRTIEAVRKLGDAAELAHQYLHPKEEILAILEYAIALDWAQRPSEAARQVERALSITVESNSDFDPIISLRLSLGQGRSEWRCGNVKEAIVHLNDAAEAAAAAADFDSHVVALLLLGPALVLQGCDKLAEARFDELFALCIPANDKFHLCAAYGNRMFLWSARKDPDRARDDLRSAKRLAEQIGHPSPERVAIYNLAEDLYWSGEDDNEALELAKRSRELAARFIEQSVAEDALLVARISLALGQKETAREAWSWVKSTVDKTELSKPTVLFSTLILYCLEEQSASRWKALLASATKELAGDDLLEFYYWLIRAGKTDPSEAVAVHATCEKLLLDHPIWQSRFGSVIGDALTQHL